MTSNFMLHILILLSAFYLFYVSLQMKASGKIPPSLVNRNVDLERAKDKEGYMHTMFPVSLVLGFLTFGLGIAAVANDTFLYYPYMDTVAMLGYAAVVIFYGLFSMRCMKRYLLAR